MRNIFKHLQGHPVIIQLLCMMLIPIMVIFLPILLLGLVSENSVPFITVVRHIPWGLLFGICIIAAVLSLMHSPTGIHIHRNNRSIVHAKQAPKSEPEITFQAHSCPWPPNPIVSNSHLQ